MDELAPLAELIKKRNLLEREITALIARPAQLGHIGEYIASKIFNIELEESASHKGIDGRFSDDPLKRCSVNIKWYAVRDGLLDVTPECLPDYYLVLTGPTSGAMASRGQVRPWTIESLFLFDAHHLTLELRSRGSKLGVACSVPHAYWQEAEVYPNKGNPKLKLTEEQRRQVGLFRAI